MTATAASTSSTPRARPHGDPGAARVFISDVRLAGAVLNEMRRLTLRRVFGVSRAEADVLTFVLALTAADATLRTARRAAQMRPPSGGDAAIGGFLVREAALGIAGPAARRVPLAGTVLAIAMVGGAALPELRRAARSLRAAEARIRAQRMGVYAAAGRTAPPAPASGE